MIPLNVSVRKEWEIALRQTQKCSLENFFTCGSTTNAHTELEYTMLITLHANGKPLLKLNSSFYPFAMILLIVWSANGDGSVLTSKTSSNLLNDDTYLISLCR